MENKGNINIYKVCCVTGHRPKGFPWNYYNTDDEQHQEYLDSLRNCIIKLIEKDGYNYFITGCAIGADLDFAEICIELRDTKYPNIIIEGAIPCDRQDLKWSTADKERYARAIEKLNSLHYVSHDFSMACFQKRNEYMVDRSDLVIAIWNADEKGGTWNTIKYARKNKKTIKYILLGFFSNSFRQTDKAMHKLIEVYNEPEKEILWQKILKRLEEENNNNQ